MKRYSTTLLTLLALASTMALADVQTTAAEDSGPGHRSEPEHDHRSHANHGSHADQLLILLNHKIALQNLQQQFATTDSLNINQQSRNLAQQKRHLDQAIPILNQYSQLPPEHYSTTSQYHESLINRAAMLQDYAQLLSRFYQQLLGD